MGACISLELASSALHEIENGKENAVYYQENNGTHENRKVGFVYSQEGTKGTNQDAGIIYKSFGVEGGILCGVFDGHGKNGHKVSKLVRNRLPSLILNQKNAITKLNMLVTYNDTSQDMESKISFYRWREACVTAFKMMDKEIELLKSVNCSSSGTAAVIVIKQGDDLVIANLGDSRAILGTVADDGALKAVPLTTDLKPNLPCEAARIKRKNGKVFALKEEPHIQRVWSPNVDSHGLAMSRTFGDFLLKKHGVISIPDIYYKNVTHNDRFIVLATDGVWDVMSNDEVAAIVLAAGSEEEAAKAVVEEAVSVWKHKFSSSRIDDCTVVCLFL